MSILILLMVVQAAALVTKGADSNTYTLLHLDEGTGNAADISANRTTCTLNGGAVWTVAGKADKALDLDGSNDTCTIPNAAWNDWALDKTISAWVKHDVVEADTFMSKDTYNFHMGVSATDKPQTGTWSWWGDNCFYCQGTTSVGTGWRHMVMVLDPGIKQQIYMDGVLECTDTTVQTSCLLPGAETTLYVGRMPHPSGAAHWNGQVDEIHMWNRLLTAPEIEYLYRSGMEAHQ